MTIHRLGEHLVPRFRQDEPGNGIRLASLDEYGIRTYARAGAVKGLEETWVVRPDATVMLYTHHMGGRLMAVYRHKAKRAKA